MPAPSCPAGKHRATERETAVRWGKNNAEWGRRGAATKMQTLKKTTFLRTVMTHQLQPYPQNTVFRWILFSPAHNLSPLATFSLLWCRRRDNCPPTSHTKTDIQLEETEPASAPFGAPTESKAITFIYSSPYLFNLFHLRHYLFIYLSPYLPLKNLPRRQPKQ